MPFIKFKTCFLCIIIIFSFIISLASISVKILKIGSCSQMNFLWLDLGNYYMDRIAAIMDVA